MEPADFAYLRAWRLLRNRAGALGVSRSLAVVEPLLALALLGVAGLLVALLATRGVTHLDQERVAYPPAWLQPRIAPGVNEAVWLPNTGLTPLVVANEGTQSPWPHRAFAAIARSLVSSVPALQTNRSALFALLAAWLGLLLAGWLVWHFRRRAVIDLSVTAAESLRHQIHRQMYRLGRSALPNEGIGNVINLFTREVNDIRDGLFIDLDRSIRIIVLGVGLLILALLIHVPLTLFLLSLCGLCALIVRPLIRSASAEADQSMRDAATQLVLLHEDLGLVRTVRVFGMEEVDRNRFDEHLEAFTDSDALRLRAEGSIRSTMILLVGIAVALGLAPLGYVELASDPYRLSLGATAVLVASIGLLIWTVFCWLGRRQALQQADRSAATVFDYLDQKPDILMSVGAQFLPEMKSQLTYENVSLAGPEGRPILAGVSVEIKANTRCAIVGLDERAKLAMACLIPRLLDPAVGRVRIDGVDLREVTLESLRAQVATVLQADLVFSDSVLANIGLGDTSFTFPKIVEAAKAAHAHHVIKELPEGYDTLLGPMGHFLQRDEEYRIALARVFLHDPAIVIIEEPHQPLDDEVKAYIDDSIDRLAQGKTLIFLPHRLSTVRRCDQVILLHNGRVESVGPPPEVSKQSKLFRHIQSLEFNRFAMGEVEVG